MVEKAEEYNPGRKRERSPSLFTHSTKGEERTSSAGGHSRRGMKKIEAYAAKRREEVIIFIGKGNHRGGRSAHLRPIWGRQKTIRAPYRLFSSASPNGVDTADERGEGVLLFL